MNRSISSVLFLLFVLVVAVGFYRGWFSLSSHAPETGGNKVDVNLTVDRDKMQQDAAAVKQKTAEIINHEKEPAQETANQGTAGR